MKRIGGGGWDILCANLAFIRELRKNIDNKIEFVCLNFVIQQNNFRQIEDFMKFAEEYDADAVEFQRLGNWGTFSDEEFKQRNVFDSSHLLYAEACQGLKDVLSKEWKVKIVQNIL